MVYYSVFQKETIKRRFYYFGGACLSNKVQNIKCSVCEMVMEEEDPGVLLTGDLFLVRRTGYRELGEDGVEEGRMNS